MLKYLVKFSALVKCRKKNSRHMRATHSDRTRSAYRLFALHPEVHRGLLFKVSLSLLPLAFALCILWTAINKPQAVGTATCSFFSHFGVDTRVFQQSYSLPLWVLLFHYIEKHLTPSSVFIFSQRELLQGLWVTLPVFNGGIIVFVELWTRVGPPKKLLSSSSIFFWLVCTWTAL